MRTSFTFATVLAAAGVLAQTPSQFQPSTQQRLNVTYNTTVVTPGIELPQALAQTVPVIATNTTSSAGPYMVVLLDLSLPAARVNGTNLVPGIAANRTTRLHWLQTNLTKNAAGVLSSTTPAAATYAGPQPPVNDTAHFYAFFLFTQPSSFVVPAALANGTFTAAGAAQRNNFSLTPITSQTGVTLLAGNYILVQNANNSGAATTPRTNGTTTAPSVPAKTGAAVKMGVALPAVGLGALAMALL